MTRLNVALAPPPPVSERLVRLADETVPADSVFRIGGGRCSPHLTLFMADFDALSLDIVLARVADVVGGEPVVTCSAQGISRTAGGYVEVAYAKTAALTAMQSSVARELRELVLPVAMPPHVVPSEDQLRNIDLYGYELMGDSFRPHVTLGRLVAGRAVMLPDTDLPALSFHASDVMVAVADDQGAARDVLIRTALAGR